VGVGASLSLVDPGRLPGMTDKVFGRWTLFSTPLGPGGNGTGLLGSSFERFGMGFVDFESECSRDSIELLLSSFPEICGSKKADDELKMGS